MIDISWHVLLQAWHVLLQLAPWILLGTLIAGLLHVLLPIGFIHRRLRGPGGVFKAVGIGVPLPLCSCGVIPAGIGLKRDGASDGAAVAFLISTPQTGVDSVLVSASFLGWPFAIFKVLAAAVTGIAGGLIVEHLDRGDAADAAAPSTETSRRDGGWLPALYRHGLDIIRSIWRWLVFGVFVSAVITVFLPPDALSGVGTMGILASCFAALAISLPLYVCATASVPIASALVASGLPPGAALVFLMAGPATNVATMGAIYRRFGVRVLSIYLATIVVGSGISALAFHGLIDARTVASAGAHEGHESWWAVAAASLMLLLFVWFALEDTRRWLRNWAVAKSQQGVKLTVSVQGMNCVNCVNRLEQALRGIDGIDSAVVHLEPGEATVYGQVDEERVREVIRSSGFQSQ